MATPATSLSGADLFTESVLAEIRAEMARQNRTRAELATALGIAYATAGQRLRGLPPFNMRELFQISEWLDRPIEHFVTPTQVAS